MQNVDNLPTFGPNWVCDIVTAHGNRTNDDNELMAPEELELWRRDPIDCVRELLGNPALRDELKFAPERVYMDKEGKVRVFDEMNTGDWWWDTQVRTQTPPL